MMATALGEHDLLTAIEVPAQAAGQGSAYVKFEHPASRYAVIGVAAVLGVSGGTCKSAAIALGGLVPRPTRAASVERRLVGQALSEATMATAAADVAADLGADIDNLIGDLYASAEYRKAVAPVWVKRALAAAAAARSADDHVMLRSIDELQALLERQLYIADRGLATSIFLALKLQRPLLLEGEAGVGKTEVAKVLAAAFDSPLIRLQCYEGLDVSHAVYEWNYARQLLEIRLMEASGAVDRQAAARELFDARFLIKRPLLQALSGDGARRPVLLIDELDRADEEFEGFLLELLADLPDHDPRARDDPRGRSADRHHHVEPDARAARRPQAALPLLLDRLPDFDKELRIVTAKVPHAPRAAGRAGDRVRPGAARGRALQAGRGFGDARLGGRARRARPDRARSGGRSTRRSASCSRTRKTSRRSAARRARVSRSSSAEAKTS